MKAQGRSRTPARGKENRTTDPVEVFCRVRPLPSDANEACVQILDSSNLKLHPPSAEVGVFGSGKTTENKFTHVFNDAATQGDVYERVARRLVADLVEGKDGLLFTYGITGSGKTFTMTGSPKECGILPRCLDVVFNSIQNLQTGKYVFAPDGYNCFDVTTESRAVIERGRAALHQVNTPLSKAASTPGRALRSKVVDLPQDDWELRPRIHEGDVISSVDEDNAFGVFVSYIEIYNNYVYDLLDTNVDPSKQPQSKGLREDVLRNMYVNGVTEVEVKSTEDAFDVFIRGQQLRRVAHTALNTESSRSHAVFNIRLVQAPLDQSGRDVLQDKSKVHVSQLSLVDLAGSERSARTGNVGNRMVESGKINTSLMILRQCIEQLRENQLQGASNLIPYRDSRLTHLFKNFFDGEGKVRMVVCLNPAGSNYAENLHVMQFAEMTQEVEVCRGAAYEAQIDGLAPGRRRAAATVRADVAEMLAETDIKKARPAVASLFFDAMPQLQMSGPDDADAIARLHSYFESRLCRRQTYQQDASKKKTEFEAALRRYAVDADKGMEAVSSLQKEVEELRADARRLHGRNRQLTNHNSTLSQRLGKYEQDAQYRQDKEEIFKQKEREMEAKVREKENKLNMLRGVVSRCPPTVGDRQDGVHGTGGLGSRGRFGGSQDALASGRGRLDPTQSSTSGGRTQPTQSTVTPRTDGTQASLYPTLPRAAPRGRRAPSPPPKPAARTPGHVNTRYHRRSRSVGHYIDHQPENKIPSGQLMQPKVRSRKVAKSRVDADDLKGATDYVLTHQETDPRTGALRTSLVKVAAARRVPNERRLQGDVLPTAGGGSAVLFNDVEQLTHRSPGKRRSDEESDSGRKRAKGDYRF